jgi:hypothetical protein
MGDGADPQARHAGQVAPFDAIRLRATTRASIGAREIAEALGYIQWRNVANVIKQARTACETDFA